MVRFTILGSGSAGNCAFFEYGETRLLIDAGFSARQIRRRLATIGRSPETLTGILLTHEHGDHIHGLAALLPRVDVPVYCNRLTRDATEEALGVRLRASLFSTGDSFELGAVTIETFAIPHDAQDPVGFLIRAGSAVIGFLTDLGHATKLVLERVRPAEVLVLEANHDLKLLQEDTRRPWSTKQRILSRHGHLSNDAAAQVAGELADGPLRRVFLGHLSRDCNRPELAHRTVAGHLESRGATQIRVEQTSQDEPCPTVTLGEAPVAG